MQGQFLMGLKPKYASILGVKSALKMLMTLKGTDRLLTFPLKWEMHEILKKGSSSLVAIHLHLKLLRFVRSKLGHSAVSFSLLKNVYVGTHKCCFTLERPS